MLEFNQATSVSDAYPERGLKAYSVVLGAWLTLFPASGLLNSTGTFQAWLFEHQLQGYSESEVAWIFSIFAFLFFFAGFVVGPIFDRYGENVLVPVGALGLTITLVTTSFSRTYLHFIVSFSLLGGISSSIRWTTSIATLGHWFNTNRDLGTGLATTAGGFGGVLYPMMFARLVHQIGFEWTMRCFALLSGCCLAAGIMLLKTRLPRTMRNGILLDWKGFRDPRFDVTMAAIFVLDGAVLVPPSYITMYANSQSLHGMSPHILAILNAASIFGRGLPGPVADRIGRFNVMVLCSFACTISTFGLWLGVGSSTAGLISFSLLYGFFSGSAYSLTPVCVAQLCKTEDYASRYGTAYGIVSLATLAGVPLSGSILGTGTGENYHALIVFCGATYAIATVLLVIARVVSKGWRLNVKF